jgi:hypothetical protein
MEKAITSSHSKLCMIDDKFANVDNLIFNENLTFMLLLIWSNFFHILMFSISICINDFLMKFLCE